MIRPVLHDVDLHEGDLRAWTPDDPDVVAIWVRLHIGAKGSARRPAHEFTTLVATPGGLAALDHRDDGVLEFRSMLVVRRYDRDVVRAALEERVASCAADDWRVCIERLAHHFDWEFDYATRWTTR
jgi:hypothetical protein